MRTQIGNPFMLQVDPVIAVSQGVIVFLWAVFYKSVYIYIFFFG